MGAIEGGPGPAGWICLGRAPLPVVAPFRLDLTVAALRRTPLNLVDVLDAEGRYLCLAGEAAEWRVAVTTQAPGAGPIEVALYAPRDAPATGQDLVDEAAARVGRRLGAVVDLTGFYAAARGLPALWPLVARAQGVKPPRYGRLWEGIANAVVFQQVSIEAATAVMRRLIQHLSPPVVFDGVTLHPFLPLQPLLESPPRVLRDLGLSEAKVRALQGAAGLLRDGGLTETAIEALPTPEALARLCEVRGIGPWTAAIVLLRGFGRLDVFPEGDSGAQRSIRGLLGAGAGDASVIVAALGPWRGMLYYHLLLWRLAQRGQVSLAPDVLSWPSAAGPP